MPPLRRTPIGRPATRSSAWSTSWPGCADRAAARGITSRRSSRCGQFVLEETYEVLDAIDRGDLEALRGEIGDFLFEGVFLAQDRGGRGPLHRC